MVHSPERVPILPPTIVLVDRNMSSRAMRRAILGAMEGEPRGLVVDLRAVRVMSDTRLAVLVSVNARQRARRNTLTLVCGDNSVTQQALARTGLTRAFTTVSGLTMLPPG